MSLTTMPKMYGHQIAGSAPGAPGVLFDYVFAGNGLFVRGQREGLSVCFPIEDFAVLGLPDMVPSFQMAYPRVPAELVVSMMQLAEHYGSQDLETLFHFSFDEDDCWEIRNPDQERKPQSCKPKDSGPGSSYERAFIEAHSHHHMQAYFSPVDDRDETGFRIYAVVGDIFRKAMIQVRVGVYGHFWTIPADWVFELPKELRDYNA